MKLDGHSGQVHLTYCTNIHAGESWSDIRASLDSHVPAIKAAVAPQRPLGIGLRLSGEAAARARHPEELAAFRDQLARLDDIKYFNKAEKQSLRKRLGQQGLAADQRNALIMWGGSRRVLAIFDTTTLRIKALVKAD